MWACGGAWPGIVNNWESPHYNWICVVYYHITSIRIHMKTGLKPQIISFSKSILVDYEWKFGIPNSDL
jgi:hypothetical protein